MSCLHRLAALALAAVMTALAGCDLDYPEIAIVNRTEDSALLKNASFNGCVWNVVLANGVATSPGRCLPGTDRVHFQMLDARAYCQEQAADGTLAGVCSCDGGAAGSRDGGVSEDLTNVVPTWFNYQTVSVKHVSYGRFYLFEITSDDMEPDFSVPGPYGH